MIIIHSKKGGQELENKILNILKRENIDTSQLLFSTRYDYSFGDLKIDGNSQQVFCNGREIALTKIEYDLLLFLITCTGKVLSKEDIFRAVWGSESQDTIKVVANTLSNLRKKIGENSDYIRTVRGGYIFSVNQAE